MDGYSRIVSWLKVLLPLAALALLGTLFLVARSPKVDTAIPFARTEIEDRLRNQQMTGAYFSGTTRNGEQLTITAQAARPGSGDDTPSAEGLHAELRSHTSGTITFTSDSGSLDPGNDSARFSGDVVIASDAGLTVRSGLLEAELSGLSAHSPGPVQAEGEIGNLSAGNMRLETKFQGGPMHMLFNNGVKLVYVPTKSESPD